MIGNAYSKKCALIVDRLSESKANVVRSTEYNVFVRVFMLCVRGGGQACGLRARRSL